MTVLPAIETSVSAEEAERLRALATNAVVLEVGSWRGFSTVLMAEVAIRVHAVDHHLGDAHAGHDESLSYLVRNLDEYGVRDRVVVHVGDVVDVVPMFPRTYFDLAFIDGFHETEIVRRDAEFVLPVVHSFGYIAFHDYGRFGVREAVDELRSRGDVDEFELTGTLAVVRKI